jgi:oligopeptide transport system substrate-binding protein
MDLFSGGNMKFKHFLYLSLPLVFLAGCQSQPKNPSPTAQVLRINFQDGDLPSTHPHIGIDYRIRSLQSALFEGLTRMDPDGSAQPAAADSIFISDDKTRYTFTIRPAFWSNSEPVTAYHFADAWEKAIAHGSGCLRPDLFYIIKNAEKIKKGELPLSESGIQVIDERTLEIELENPAPYFLELISNPIFSPLFDQSEEPMVFNGPFVIDTWKLDNIISLKKNHHYWDASNVSLENIKITVITDALTAFQLFEKGELDWIGAPFSCLPNDMIPTFEQTGMLKSKEVARIYWLYCNNEVAPFNNPSIRKALSYAIDRKDIVEHVLFGQSTATTPLPSSLSLLKADALPEHSDISQARQFFEQGLQELGLTADTFPKITLSHSHITGQRQLAEIIQSNWQSALGVTVALEGSEWNHFFSNLSRGNFEIGGCIKSALFRDPIYHLELLQDKTLSYNVGRWEDSQYKSLLQQARDTTDLAGRANFLEQAERILLDQMPVIPVYGDTYLYAMRPHIQGVVIHDLGHVDFKWIKVDTR